MFVQVIQGRVTDQERVHSAMDKWAKQLSPAAVGWLGSTAGVTDDGRFIALVRFESEDAARRNSNRPEQGEWWAETATVFTGEASFHDSTHVDVDLVADPDDSGFVQVIQGRSASPEHTRELMAQDSDEWAEFRPDIIGSIGVEHIQGAYTVAVYFTSEEEAREGERKEPPPELRSQLEEMDEYGVGEPEFFDLRQPWLYSPT